MRLGQVWLGPGHYWPLGLAVHLFRTVHFLVMSSEVETSLDFSETLRDSSTCRDHDRDVTFHGKTSPESFGVAVHPSADPIRVVSAPMMSALRLLVFAQRLLSTALEHGLIPRSTRTQRCLFRSMVSALHGCTLCGDQVEPTNSER